MEYEIRHTGIITESDPAGRTATVALTDKSSSDCAGCAVKSLCHTGDKTDGTTMITVSTNGCSRQPVTGTPVEIGIPLSGRYRALITALGVPCLLLAAAAIGLSAAGIGEELAALCAIGLTAAYYAVLFLFRKQIRSRYRWQIIRILDSSPQQT